jgi:hypothetical protein
MEPRPIFKRRHFDNPVSFSLIMTNYIVTGLGLAIFVNSQHKIYWFFWVIMGGLAIYNAFSVYRYREDYTKIHIIAYAISLAGLSLLFLIL